MYRLSLIIGEIYKKFLPLAEQGKISLNLDFSDTTKEVSDPKEIRAALEQALESAFQRTDRGDISISVSGSEIVISDSGTIISKAACTLLSHGRVQVKSRVGFGTSVHISLAASPKKDETPENKIIDPEPQELKIALKAELEPTTQTQSKATTKTPKKKVVTATSKRAISAAAKRADKKVQKIAEKAQKRREKASAKKKRKVTYKIDLS